MSKPEFDKILEESKFERIADEFFNFIERLRILFNLEKKEDTFSEQESLLTRKEASKYLGVAVGTLAVWACNKRYNLPMVKVGHLVRYRKSDLDAFLERGRFTNQEENNKNE